MAIPVQQWHVDSVAYAAVGAWTALTPYVAGNIVRQLATPAVGNERCFVCVIAGTSLAAEPASWTLTKGGQTAETAGPTWREATGQAALCGNNANTIPWLTVKNQAVLAGFIIRDGANTRYLICTTGGTTGNGAEPTWNTTLGAQTSDNTATWTNIGVIGNFVTAFGAPHARLNNVYNNTNWAATGDTVLVGDDHAETTSAAMNIAPTQSDISVYCVDHTKVSPGSGDLKTTATLTTTTAGMSIVQNSSIRAYFYGLKFICGSGDSSTRAIRVVDATVNCRVVLDSCSLQLATTDSASTMRLPNVNTDSGVLILNNTTLKFAHVGQHLNNVGRLIWQNTPSAIDATGSAPTTLFNVETGFPQIAQLTGVDLSFMGSGKTIVGNQRNGFLVVLADCKINAAVTVAATPIAAGGSTQTDMIRCDSAATSYRQARFWYEGTMTTETTIVRTGGASDGTTPISWKIVATANSSFWFPFEIYPITIWNSTVGSSVTATIQIVNDGVTLTNGDVWIDAEYLGSTLTPQGSFATASKANGLASNTNLTTSAVTWTTTGLASPVKQSIAVSFTPQMIGYLSIIVKVAKASQTVYVDPLVVLS